MTPVPAEPHARVTVPGHVVEVAQRGPQTEVLVYPEGAPYHHVALRIADGPGGPALLAGFSAEVREVCLPEHLDPEAAVVEAAAEALVRLSGPDAPPLVEALRARWAAARARLQARQAALLGEGRLAQSVVLVRGHGPVLMAEGTRMAQVEPSDGREAEAFGITLSSDGSRLVEVRRKDCTALTADALVRAQGLSGHEKLSILAMVRGGAEHPLPELRAHFLTRPRRPGICALPVARAGFAAWRRGAPGAEPERWSRGSAEVHGPGGIGAYVSSDPQEGGAPRSREARPLSLVAYGPKPDQEIRIETTDRDSSLPLPPAIRRRRKGKSGFPSVDDLDAMLRAALALLFVLGPEVGHHRIVPGKRVLPPKAVATHPLLSGIEVPAAMHPLLGLLLGSPYEHARRVAERQNAREAKKAEARRSVAGLADTLADGRLAGNVRASWKTPIKFGTVRTDAPAAGHRKARRTIHPLTGWKAPRALTPATLAKLPPLTEPAALHGVHDEDAGRDRRDLVETAFRLSLRLPGGAPNPLLEGAVTISHHAAPLGFRVRRTSMAGDASVHAEAFAVTRDAAPLRGPRFTGPGFAILWEGARASYDLRPALDGPRPHLRDLHRTLIADALCAHLGDPAEALHALDALWARGPAED